MKVTIDGRRYDLDGMTELNVSHVWQCGSKTVAAYYGPITHRIIVHRYSIWEKYSGSHDCIGDMFTVHEPTDPDYGTTVEWLESEGADLSDAPVETVTEGDTR